MSVLVFVERGDELSLQALTLARGARRSGARDLRRPAGSGRPAAPSTVDGSLRPPRGPPRSLAADGVDAIVGPGSDRGNEVLAHVAARLDLPFAANVVRGRRGTP